MLRGIYNQSRGSARDLEAMHRLEGSAADSELLHRGPLAVAWSPDSGVHCAEVEEISCVVQGYLYEPADLVGELGVSGGNAAEVIARAYRRFGTEALTKLRGSFAVALWDSTRARGLLVSDLLATRPLYFSRGVGWLAFATELRELLAIVPSRPGPDQIAFVSWVGGGLVPPGSTLYDGMSRLGPGHLIELGANGERPRRYWRPRYDGIRKGTREEHADALRSAVERSVARRMSPRHSGVVLSGGLDSSIVTAAASRVKPPDAQLRTYSAVFPGFPAFDEGWKVRSLTTALGVDRAAFQIEPQGALWLGLRNVKRWELPLFWAGGIVEAPIFAEAASDGVEVALDGQIGDEVFGMAPFLVSDRLMRGRLLAALELINRWPSGHKPNPRQVRWALVNVGLKGAAPYRLYRMAQLLRARGSHGAAWLRPEVRNKYVAEDKWAWKAGVSGPRWWRFLVDALVEAPHRELRIDYLRHRAATAGVLNESPLYDFDLTEFCLGLPPELAFDRAHTRPLAREAMRGHIPDDVRLNDQKANFSGFCYEMLTGADAPGIGRLLTAPDAEIGAYVDLGRIRRMWLHDRPRPGEKTMMWGTEIWRLAAAETWLRAQADPGFADEMLARPDVLPPAVRRVDLADTGTFSSLAGVAGRT